MKGIFLSNTPSRAPQSFAISPVPIGECARRVRIVIACVHFPWKSIARCGPILLARMRSLFLAQILPGRRHARSLFAKLSTRQWHGSRRALGLARQLGIGKYVRRAAIHTRAAIRRYWAGYGPEIHRAGSLAAHPTPAGLDDGRCRWRPPRNHFDERNAARGF